jgi:hypothetical protein
MGHVQGRRPGHRIGLTSGFAFVYHPSFDWNWGRFSVAATAEANRKNPFLINMLLRAYFFAF